MKKRNFVRSALATCLAAGAVVAVPGAASAAEARVQGGYWSTKCDYGRACVWDTRGHVFNAGGCGWTEVGRVVSYAQSHGNSFTIYFASGQRPADTVQPWTRRGVSTAYEASAMVVNC